MITPDLLKYVQEALAKTSPEAVKANLAESGWNSEDIELAITQASASAGKLVSTVPEGNNNNLESTSSNKSFWIILTFTVLAIAGGAGTLIYATHNLKQKAQPLPTLALASPLITNAPSPSTTPSPTPTPVDNSPTAGWITYHASECGVSFKYPSTWTLTHQPGLNSAGYYSYFLKNSNKSYTYTSQDYQRIVDPLITLDCGQDTSGANINKHLSNIAQQIALIQPGKVTIGGKQAYVQKGTITSSTTRTYDARIIFDSGNYWHFSSEAQDIKNYGAGTPADIAEVQAVYDNLLASVTFP